MAIRQSSISEIRYSKRQNLEQEAKILGNMYRDQIHAQGIDCLYYKLDKTLMHTYKNIVDDNNLLFHAYGYDHNPEYSLSTYMIVYMEVENDVFNLNKYGIVPNMDVTFVFDRLDFACAVAPKFGQYAEEQISSIDFCYAVEPSFPVEINERIDQTVAGTAISVNISAALSDLSPGMHEEYCQIVDKGFIETKFPVNDDIYKSFMHRILNENDIKTCIKIKYEVENTANGKFEISGSIDGSILFYDVHSLEKYYDLLHPDVGDIITIDFPNGKNREQYEITEAVDKHIATDGINAFLHKYIWRCKGRRYINSYEDMEKNEANERLEEQNKYDAAAKEQITKDISVYKDNEDDVYGGYENPNSAKYDRKTVDTAPSENAFIPADMLECIIEFQSGSKLATDGYELLFIRKNGTSNQLAFNKDKTNVVPLPDTGIQWLKANDENIVFNSLDGKSFMLAFNEQAAPAEQQICLNSLFDLTFDDQRSKNQQKQNFYKFKNSRTILFATEDNLFCYLASRKMYKLA